MKTSVWHRWYREGWKGREGGVAGREVWGGRWEGGREEEKQKRNMGISVMVNLNFN